MTLSDYVVHKIGKYSIGRSFKLEVKPKSTEENKMNPIWVQAMTKVIDKKVIDSVGHRRGRLATIVIMSSIDPKMIVIAKDLY